MKTISLLLIQILLFINIMNGVDTYTWSGSWSPSTPAGHLDDDNKDDVVTFSSGYSTPSLVLTGTNSNEDITINVNASQTVAISSLTYGRNVTINLLANATLNIGDIDCDNLVINQADGSSLTTGSLSVTDLTVNTGDDDGDSDYASTAINGTLTNSGNFTVTVEQGCEFDLDAGTSNITVADIVFDVKSSASMEITVGDLESTGNNGATINVESTGELIIHGNLVVGSQFDFTIANGGSLEVDSFTLGNSVDGDVDGTLTVNEDLTLAQNGTIDSPGGTGAIIVGGVIDDPNGVIDSAIIDDGTFYIWNGSVDTDYQNEDNWTPARSIPDVDDVLQFVDVTVEATNVPTQTIKKITISNSNVTLTPTSTNVLTLTGVNNLSVSILINSSLTISPQMYLSTENIDIETNGNLIIADNSTTKSGQIYASGSITSSGTCTFKRYLTTAAHHYVSSPVDAAGNALGLGVAPKVKTYWNETVGEWQGISTDLSVGIGYDYYFSQNVTAEFTGSSFNMDDTYNAIPISNGAGGGFNLIGNPYPFAINAEEVLNMNTQDLGGANSITGTIAIWDEGSDVTPYDESFYILVTGAGSVAGKYKTFNGYIAPGQAFFVEAAAASTGTFTINKTMAEVSQTPVFFKSAKKETDIQRLKLFVDNGTNSYSEILVAFKEGTSMDKDPAYDAGNAETGKLSLYSFIQDDKYAIQAQPVLNRNENRIVNLGLNVKRKGNVEFNIKEKLNLGENVKVFLEDLYNDTIIEMGKAQGYFVNLEKKRYDKRFRLIFRNDDMLETSISQYKSLNTQEAIENEVNSVPDVVQDFTFTTNINTIKNRLHIYSHKKTMHVKSDKIIENANIEIYNLLGTKVASFEFLSTQQSYTLPNVKEGIYIVSIEQQNKSLKAVKLFFK